jgi:HEPN domain-containing protein
MPDQRRQSIPPSAIFEHADRFFIALAHLHDAPEDKMGAIILPSGVIAEFASELYLKSFIAREKRPIPKGHHLHDLYTSLLRDTRTAIERHWNAIVRDHKETIASMDRQGAQTTPQSIEDALREGNKAFEQLRYIYENSSPFFFVLGELPIALRRALLDIEPSWGQQDGIPIGLSYPAAIDVGARREGSISYRRHSLKTGWADDFEQYQLSPAAAACGIRVTAFKNPDRRISVTIGGPLGRTF